MKKLQTATVLPQAPAPVNERPDGMSFEDYKKLRKETNKTIRDRVKKGFLVFLSNEILLDAQNRPVGMKYRYGKTFVGNTRFLQLV